MDGYICTTVYSTPEWSYSVTHKHTNKGFSNFPRSTTWMYIFVLQYTVPQRTFHGVLRGCIYLFYSIQYPRVVILRNKHTNTHTHKANLKESRIFEIETIYSLMNVVYHFPPFHRVVPVAKSS